MYLLHSFRHGHLKWKNYENISFKAMRGLKMAKFCIEWKFECRAVNCHYSTTITDTKNRCVEWFIAIEYQVSLRYFNYRKPHLIPNKSLFYNIYSFLWTLKENDIECSSSLEEKRTQRRLSTRVVWAAKYNVCDILSLAQYISGLFHQCGVSIFLEKTYFR